MGRKPEGKEEVTTKMRYWSNEAFRQSQKENNLEHYRKMKAEDPEWLKKKQKESRIKMAEKKKAAEEAGIKTKISRQDLALEFNQRYGTDLKVRMLKLCEETTELEEAMAEWDMVKETGNTSDRMRAFYRMRNELRDVMSVANQLEHLMLKTTWPKEVHMLLAERDKDPNYGRIHEHVRNVEAGE